MMINFEKLGDNVCLSGGADGADLEWGLVAATMQYDVIHWSFKGHRSNAPKKQLAKLTNEQLAIADPFLVEAAKKIQKKFPPKSTTVKNLLRRNYYQISLSDSLYAISTIKDGLVQGGTGWAVMMYLQKFNYQSCPCYVFCQEAGSWYEWKDGNWQEIYSPPMPKGIWAGIGSRELLWNGKLAIRVLLQWKRPTEAVSVFSSESKLS